MAELISQLCGQLQPAVCLSRICSHLKATCTVVDVWQASETSHRKSSPGNFQHQYLAELLVNVYSYRLMVKSVSSCCMRGSRLFSNLITYFLWYTLSYCISLFNTVFLISTPVWYHLNTNNIDIIVVYISSALSNSTCMPLCDWRYYAQFIDNSMFFK